MRENTIFKKVKLKHLRNLEVTAAIVLQKAVREMIEKKRKLEEEKRLLEELQ